jgi:hypothetical protein
MPSEVRTASVSLARAASLSSVWMVTRSVPTDAFRAAGVSRATSLPSSMMAIRSQCSASSM